jgi:hypothetical protein
MFGHRRCCIAMVAQNCLELVLSVSIVLWGVVVAPTMNKWAWCSAQRKKCGARALPAHQASVARLV